MSMPSIIHGKGLQMKQQSKRQAVNPYLPLYEYIPDGEPHVFGDRLYLYGSHDRFDGRKFCENDYVCWSAPVTDLADWRYEGVIYHRTRDPRMPHGEHELWAPDVVQGKDGRYYLYYCPDDKVKSIGVAVCDTPAGHYMFYGVVRDREGGILGERPGDTIPFDPGVFRDEDGTVYLYSGNGPRTEKKAVKTQNASVVMTLEDDMLTLRTEPRRLLPTVGHSRDTGFAGHELFEASSIRKIRGKYYLVYSSIACHELCYAVSDRPDRGFRYGGVVVSNCDLFPGKKPRYAFGNNHGGLECINGQYYIFYHRPTNRSMYSRQGCAERVEIRPDGSIPQVCVTSCGLNGGPLAAKGSYPATICCHLYGKRTPTYSVRMLMGNKHPYITQDGPDWSPGDAGQPPRQYIANGRDGMTAVYRYFHCEGTTRIQVTVRGRARGRLLVRLTPGGEPVGAVDLVPSGTWTKFSGQLAIPDGDHTLCLCYEGKGRLDFLEFSLS